MEGDQVQVCFWFFWGFVLMAEHFSLFFFPSRVLFPVSLDFLLPGQGKGGGTCLQHAGRQS